MSTGRMIKGVKAFFRRYSDEIKLFVTFFLVFLLFVQWIGANEYSRLNLTRTIVDGGEFNVDVYANNTEDKVFYEGHFYSDKAPVSSMVGAPAYLLAKTFFPVQPGEGEIEKGKDFTGEMVVVPFDMPRYLAVAQILFVILIGVIPGALLVVFVKWYVERYYSRKVAVATAALIGGGTLLFFYSTTALATVLGALFAFLSFFYADKGGGFVAGVFAMLAVFTVYYLAVFPAMLLAFLVWREEWDILRLFLFGCVIGAAPALIYYVAVAGGDFISFALKTVLKLPLEGSQETSNIFVSVSSFSSLIGLLRNLPYLGVVVAKLLVYPVRGLFFYSPVLLLAFVALRWRESLRGGGLKYFGFALLGVTIIANASLDNWFAGASFGPRYLVPAIPFFCLPLAHALEKGGRAMWRAAAVLGLAGVFQNLVGTLGAFFPAVEDLLILRGDAAFNLDVLAGALQPFSTHLYWQQVEQFLAWGANYRILSRPLSGMPLDIRAVMPAGKADLALMEIGESIVTYSVDWMFLPVVAGIVFAIWRVEIGEMLTKTWQEKTVIGIALLALLMPLSIHSTAFTGGFPYPESGGWRWMEENGTVKTGVGEGAYRMEMEVASFNASARTVSLAVDGRKATEFVVANRSKSVFLYYVSNDSHVVDIGLRSRPGCATSYASCLSVGVSDMEAERASMVKGALPIDGRISGLRETSNGTLLWEKGGRAFKASLHIMSSSYREIGLFFNTSRFTTEKLFMSVNGGEWRKVQLDDVFTRETVDLAEGVNTVELYPGTLNVLAFDSGFYGWERDGDTRFRWLRKKASLSLIADTQRELTVVLEGRSFADEEAVVAVNADNRTVDLPSAFARQNLSFMLEKGVNTLRIRPAGCTTPSKISDTGDDRCLSVAFRSMSARIGEPQETVKNVGGGG